MSRTILVGLLAQPSYVFGVKLGAKKSGAGGERNPDKTKLKMLQAALEEGEMQQLPKLLNEVKQSNDQLKNVERLPASAPTAWSEIKRGLKTQIRDCLVVKFCNKVLLAAWLNAAISAAPEEAEKEKKETLNEDEAANKAQRPWFRFRSRRPVTPTAPTGVRDPFTGQPAPYNTNTRMSDHIP